MPITSLYGGVLCLWDDASVSVLDAFTGSQLSCIQATAAYSTSSSSAAASPSAVTIQHVGGSPPYKSASARSRRTFTPLMLVLRVEEEQQQSSHVSLVAIFVVAETGEILGGMPLAADVVVESAACVPVFADASIHKNPHRRNLATATSIAWAAKMQGSNRLVTGIFLRNEQHLPAHEITTPGASQVVDFALSFDDATNTPLLHTIEKEQQQTVVVKEYRCAFGSSNEGESVSQEQPGVVAFTLAWATQPICTLGASSSSSPRKSSPKPAPKAKKARGKKAAAAAQDDDSEAVANNDEDSVGDAAAKSILFDHGRCFLRMDSRNVGNNALVCFCVSAGGVVAVALTPESTNTFTYLFQQSSKEPLSSVQLIEKPGSRGTVGFVCGKKSGTAGVAWLAFSSPTTPAGQIHDSWTTTAASAADESLEVAVVSPTDTTQSEVAQRAEIFFATFTATKNNSSDNVDNKTKNKKKKFSMDLIPIGFSSAAPNPIVLDTDSASKDTFAPLSRIWSESRDIVASSTSQQQQQQKVAVAPRHIIVLRADTDAARIDLDTAQWHKWQRVGEILAAIATKQPTLLFLSSSPSSSPSAVVEEATSARWPTAVLRTALRALGPDAVRRLVAGLLDNLETAAQHQRSFAFSLACAIKVAESTVVMQRSLGVDLSSVLAPFAEKTKALERAWAEMGSAGQRIAAASSLAMMSARAETVTAAGSSAVVGADGAAASRRQEHDDESMEQAVMLASGGVSSSTASIDDAASVVARLKRRHNIPEGLFA